MMQKKALSLGWEGYRAIIPLMIGVTPFGFIFGALAVNAGMTVIQALGMSMIVLAGSAQFIAVGLIASQAPLPIIILTTFVVNLRHFLYSASLEHFFRPLGMAWKALLGYTMVDEIYAVVIVKHQNKQLSPGELRWYFLGAAFNLTSLWWA